MPARSNGTLVRTGTGRRSHLLLHRELALRLPARSRRRLLQPARDRYRSELQLVPSAEIKPDLHCRGARARLRERRSASWSRTREPQVRNLLIHAAVVHEGKGEQSIGALLVDAARNRVASSTTRSLFLTYARSSNSQSITYAGWRISPPSLNGGPRCSISSFSYLDLAPLR